MKKIFYLIVFISLLFSCYEKVLTQPKWTLHVTGGYSMPLQDLKTVVGGNGTDSTLFPYEMKNGYNVGANGEVALGRKRNFKIVFGLNIARFRNSVNLPNIYSQGQTVTFSPSLSIITFSIGGEYDLLPKNKVNPFIGIDFTGNLWGGSFSFDNSGDSLAYYPVKMKSAMRLGIQFGAGAEIMFGREVGGIVGIKYNMANLIGNSYNNPSDIPENEVDLGDKAHDNMPSRNISYLQIYLGVSFYFEFLKPLKK